MATLVRQPSEPEDPDAYDQTTNGKLCDVSRKDDNPELGLRVTVEPGGCHGYVYKLELTSDYDTDDFVWEQNGARVIIDSVSLGLVKGSTIDYVTELIGSQFAIKDNPQAKVRAKCDRMADSKSYLVRVLCSYIDICAAMAKEGVHDYVPAQMSKKYEVTETVLGQGTFALVKLCIERETGVRRAVKILPRQPLGQDSTDEEVSMLPARQAKKEIEILLSVRHPNVIRLWDFYESEEGLFLVMDYCGGGELFDNIVSRVSFKEQDARFIVRQLLSAVDYLHERNIIHRDLKPENILLHDKDDVSKGMVVTDFGLAKIMPEDGLLLTACGSPEYVAPEVLLEDGYDALVDVWSCGVITYALLCGYTPFHSSDTSETLQRVFNMDFQFHEKYWSTQSNEARDFIRKCLTVREARMSCKEALAHPWLKDLDVQVGDGRHSAELKRARPQPRSSTRHELLQTRLEHLDQLQDLRRKHRVVSNEEEDHMDRFLSSLRRELDSEDFDGHSFEDVIREGATKSSSKCRLELHAADDEGQAPGQVPVHGATASHETSSAQEEAPTPISTESAESATSRSQKATDSSANSGPTDELSRALSPPVDATHLSSSKGKSPYTGHYIRESSSVRSRHQRHESVEVLNKLLEQFGESKLPADSRVDPKAEMRPQESLTMLKALRAIPGLVHQGFSIGSAIASHVIYGPPKKSWGVEMSILTRMIRETAERHSSLATISGLQRSLEWLRFLPIPEDGLVTPVTFRVKRRELRGLLKEPSMEETGKRELTGEWIVGKQTWKRLQMEWQSGKRTRNERVILYIHGGAYFVMSSSTHRPLTIALSKYCECRVFCINYRLAPETIFPGALLDVVSAYFRLVQDLHIPPNNIVVAADSAGGGLAIGLMMYLRDNEYPLPAAAILMSPWVDLTLSCDSWETNKEFDYLPRPGTGDHMNPINAYLGPNIDKYLMHPYVSPLFGKMEGLPPMLIQSGDAEVLRDEDVLFAHKCSLAGVPVRHEIYEDCVHVFQFFLFLEASRKAFQSMRHFMRSVLDKEPRRRATNVTADAREQLDHEMAGVGAAAPSPEMPSSPGASQRRAEELDEGGRPHHTLKGLGPDDDDDVETWELDGDDRPATEDAEHSLPEGNVMVTTEDMAQDVPQ